LLLAPLALTLCGCVALGSIDRRATAFNEGTGTAQNRAILLNLVRASHYEPVYFLAMTQLNGSGTEDLKIGIPEVTFGPKQPLGQHNYIIGGTVGADANALDSNIVSSFQESVLNSKDFYAGLMAPLDLQDVDLLLHQGFARELIFYLVIEKATITPKGGDPFVIWNDPSDPKRFAVFQTYIKEAMMHGLTTQSYMAPNEEGDETAAGRESGGGKAPAMTPHAELCYDRALAAPASRKDFPVTANLCSATHAPHPETSGSNLTVNLYGQQLEIEVTTRSIFGIFNYLGGIIARGDPDAVRLHAYPELPAEITVDAPLLEVTKGDGPDGGCFIALGYEGERYCVPEQGAENTKKIFNILNALLALKTAPGDLPVTQTVRIAP
jgi:hypothetical protein